jgi:hypothetical protein
LFGLPDFEQAPCLAEDDQRTVEEFAGLVPAQRPRERPGCPLGITQREQRVTFMEEELALRVSERGICPVAARQVTA